MDTNSPRTFGLSPNVQGGFISRPHVATGSFGCVGSAWSAFVSSMKSASQDLSNITVTGDSNKGDSVNFSASRASAIYKTTSKIQVRSAQLLMIIKM